MIVLKLGGSVITEKDRPETIDGEALEAAAEAVAAAPDEELVIVHGGGSFGHHHASEHGVSTTDGTGDAGAALEIHGAMTTLNRFVLGRLHDYDVPAVPVHPFSTAHRDDEGELTLPTGQVRTLLEEGFVPVLHGDVVGHAGKGVTVVSGDELVTELATDLEATRIGLCSTVPGVLDDDGEVIDRITAFEDVEDVLGGSDATDVTGGMAAKVKGLLTLEASASIFGPEALETFLVGGEPGTTLESDREANC